MEFLTALTTEAVSKLGNLVVGSTLKQFKYLIHHKKILANLKEEHDNLKDVQQELQQRVEVEERNEHEIKPIVKRWLSEAEVIENELQGFFENEVNLNKKCLGGKCPNLAFNYSLGKQATEMVEKITSLLKEKEDKFHKISYPKATLRLGSTFTDYIKSFKSRDKIIKEVIEKLNDEKLRRIGICGMGGVGKTTLVKKVIKDIEASKLFDEVAMAVVSQNLDYEKIQDQIADNLGLKLTRKSTKGRAMQLHGRLNKANSRVLIVLDDVWDMLDFELIGIPEGCKILFTSRDEKVCEEMGSQKNFLVSFLSEDEAWYLFKEMAGNVANEPNIHPIAKQIAKECGGLPLAIVIVGKALANKKIHTWNDTLEQLRKSQSSSSFKDVHEKVYSRIELSISFLGSKEYKFILFLCSLFPEDFDIPIEILLRHAMGLGLLNDIDSPLKARDRVYNLVDKLKRCFLLLESEEPGFVKMHDLVRDVVISIASRVENEFMVLLKSTGGITAFMKKLKEDKFKAISLILDEKIESQDDLEHPTLELLQIQSIGKERNLLLPEHFFRGSMTKLKVLSLRNLQISQKQSLLSQASINLHTLLVEYCYNVEDVSVIGKQLVNLEILSFAHSDIKELPVEIGQLSSLRLLDLTGCDNLNFISANVFTRLSRLEELYFRIVNFPWKRNDAIITELQNIISHQLKVIEVKVRDARILGKNLDLDLDHNKLEKFRVYVAPYTKLQISAYLESNLLQVTATDYNSLKCNGIIMHLVKKCETLILSKIKGLKNVVNELDDHGFQYLKDLSLESCPSLECLVDSTANCDALFPQIQSLSLKKLDNLKEIVCNSSSFDHGFQCLKDLRIDSCPSIEYLIDSTVNSNAFSQIQSLSLKNLDNLGEICNSFDVKESMIEFSNLMKLELIDIPSLTGFNKAMGGLNEFQPENDGDLLSESHSKPTSDRSLSASVTLLFSSNWMRQFPKLKTLLLQNCASLDTIFDLHGNSELDGYIFPQLNDIKIIGQSQLRQVWRSNTLYNVRGFQTLRSLTISGCDSLRHVFTPAIVRAINKLEKLEISDCKLMKTLAIDDEEDDYKTEEKVKVVLFDKLDSLTLSRLSIIDSLCANSYELELSSLRKLEICDCPKLNIQFLLTQAYAKHNNLSATTHLTVDGTNFEENYSRSCSWHFGCPPLRSKLISHNINKKSNKTALLPHDLAPSSMKQRNAKEEMGRMPVVEELDIRNRDFHDKHVFKEGDETRTRRSLVIDGHLFTNLKTLIMQECNKISVLLSPSTSRCLEHLEKLHLEDCRYIEEIVFQEETDSSANNIIFHRLQRLLLRNLPSLKAFCQCSYNFDFPSLQNVEIKDCPNMKVFSQGSSHTPKLEDVTVEIKTCKSNYIQKKDLNATLQGFYAFVALHGTNKLRWTELHDEGIARYFIDKYSTMDISEFHEISTVFPVNEIHMLQLQRGKGLSIKKCYSLVEVFESEGGGVDATTIQYELEKISLSDLPKLRHIWKHNMTGRFGKLTSIYIEDCHSLKSLLSYSMARSLVQLERLIVWNCKKMEKIVTKEDHEKGGGSKVKILFPKLRMLFLYCLPELECVCSGDYDYDLLFPSCDDNEEMQISFPQLQDLTLKYVPKLKCFVSGAYDYGIVLSTITTRCSEGFIIEECPKITTVHSPRASVSVSTPNLQHLVWDYRYIRTLGEGDVNLTIHYMLNSEKYKVELQKLETLKGIEEDRDDEFGWLRGYISRVLRLELEHCDKLLNCIPSNLMTRHFLSHLTSIDVRHCAFLEEIFESNDDDIHDCRRDSSTTTTTEEPYEIKLHSLPKLKHIWRSHHDTIIFGFNLRVVEISECHDLKYVFPDVSVATSLTSLLSLIVWECNKMEAIFKSIQQPASAAAKDKEKEEEANKIIFPSLHVITLEKLPNLICFYPSSCYLELPSCRWIRIKECPKMETFSYEEEGTVYAPSLLRLSVDNSQFDTEEDVNEVIRRYKSKVIN